MTVPCACVAYVAEGCVTKCAKVVGLTRRKEVSDSVACCACIASVRAKSGERGEEAPTRCAVNADVANVYVVHQRAAIVVVCLY